MENSFIPNVKIGDKIVVKNKKDFMEEPMFEVGQEWVVVEKDLNYTLVKMDNVSYWIGDILYSEVFENNV